MKKLEEYVFSIPDFPKAGILFRDVTGVLASGEGFRLAVDAFCRRLEGEFLDWRKVVPMNSPIKLIASVSELAASVDRVGLIVSEKYKSPIRCTFANQELQMRTSTTIGSAEDKCSYAGDGQELEIGFNVRYMADALRAIPSEEVTLELTNGLSPIVLTPVDEKSDFAYMVLPVRIKG